MAHRRPLDRIYELMLMELWATCTDIRIRCDSEGYVATTHQVYAPEAPMGVGNPVYISHEFFHVRAG